MRAFMQHLVRRADYVSNSLRFEVDITIYNTRLKLNWLGVFMCSVAGSVKPGLVDSHRNDWDAIYQYS